MAKLKEQFNAFLSNINPNEDAVKYAQEAHKPIRECLESEDEFKEFVEGSFLYGSYRRHTAVGDIKDVDIVVLTNFDIEDRKNTPQSVLRRLKAALGRCYDDPENPQYQRRSIRIDDPLPEREDVTMTLDIIPAVIKDTKDDSLLVPDREVGEWILSHPKGHISHTTALNESSNGQYVPLVKMMKWWWQYQSEVKWPDVDRPKPKGFWVECLTGEMFDLDQNCWADHFIAVLENLTDTYGGATNVPSLDDPGIKDETVKTSMTLEEFYDFLNAAEESLELAKTARDAVDPTESSTLWREIFGEKFPLYDQDETEESRGVASSNPTGDTSHIQPLPWPLSLQSQYKVRIDAYVYRGNQRLGGVNSNGRILQSGLDIKYVARTKAGTGCEIYWQVVNTGKHAAEENGLRGDYFPARESKGGNSQDPRVNWEHTQYTGKHWIECFVVKDKQCVGRSGKFFVNIRNYNYP
jgi:hypothetical protein